MKKHIRKKTDSKQLEVFFSRIAEKQTPPCGSTNRNVEGNIFFTLPSISGTGAIFWNNTGQNRKEELQQPTT